MIRHMHFKRIALVCWLVMAAALLRAPTLRAQNAQTPCACAIPNGPPNPKPYLVGYLGVYKNLDWVAAARTLDFNKMTHLNLAFINPPQCDGTCTKNSDLTLGANRSFTEE